MKKVLLASLLLITLGAKSQIQLQKSDIITNEIGKVKMGTYFHASLTRYVENKDTVYGFMYANKSYQHITDIKSILFNSDGGAVDQLYSIFKSVFSDDNKKNKDYKVKFQLGTKSVEISNYRNLGVTSAMLYCYNDESYIWLSENQIDKLFGKN